MPERTVDQLRLRLQALQPERLDIIDDSARHAGHEGARDGGGHYRLTLVSGRFRGLAPLARHRLVYDAAGAMMQREIHALTMILKTPEEAGVAPPPPLGR
jgi:BolA protein